MVVAGVVVDEVVIVVDDLRLACTLNCLRNGVMDFLWFPNVVEDVRVVVNGDEVGLVRRLYLTVDDFVVILSVVG